MIGTTKKIAVGVGGGGLFVFLLSHFLQLNNDRLALQFEIQKLEREIKKNSEIIEVLRDLQTRVVGRTRAGWHRDTMERWVLEFKKLNPTLNVPDTWDEKFDPKPR